MKVILTSNIKKLGKIGDLVSVKDGFARNYLFPQKKALRENKKNLEYYEKIKDEIAAKEQIKKEYAETLLSELDKIKIEFIREADEKDQLYGSVSVKDVHNFLLEKNIKLNAEDIIINNPIKSVGEHSITINPYENLAKQIKLFVNK